MPSKNSVAPKLFALSARLSPLIDAIDRRLRERLHVTEYSASPDCLFRLQIIESEDEVSFEDGTSLQIGDRIIDLHFWNEHLPAMPDEGPTLAFARRIERRLDASLSELSCYLRTHEDLADVKAVRGNMSLGAADRSRQIIRLAERFGFRSFSRPSDSSFRRSLHWFGENILVTLLVLRRNPRAVRGDTLWRARTLTYLSRTALEQRYPR